jgi:hypothetical protein
MIIHARHLFCTVDKISSLANDNSLSAFPGIGTSKSFFLEGYFLSETITKKYGLLFFCRGNYYFGGKETKRNVSCFLYSTLLAKKGINTRNDFFM